MTDEHPNERLVTPSEDGEGFERSLVSRRQMLGGSALLAGLLAYTSDPTQPTNPNVGVARAADNPDEPLIILGPESDPVGYLFQDTAGGIILQDATSGNHFWYNQAQGRWETDAELDVPTLTAENLDIGSADFVDSGDFLATGPSWGAFSESFGTTSTSYVADSSFHEYRPQWDVWAPANAQTAIYSYFQLIGSDGDVRLRNGTNGEDVFEESDLAVTATVNRVDNYTPTTTDAGLTFRYEIRTNDGGTSSSIRWAGADAGVQV